MGTTFSEAWVCPPVAHLTLYFISSEKFIFMSKLTISPLGGKYLICIDICKTIYQASLLGSLYCLIQYPLTTYTVKHLFLHPPPPHHHPIPPPSASLPPPPPPHSIATCLATCPNRFLTACVVTCLLYCLFACVLTCLKHQYVSLHIVY